MQPKTILQNVTQSDILGLSVAEALLYAIVSLIALQRP